MAEALQHVKSYIELEEDWRSHRKQVEAPAWWKESFAKIED